jgi:hypothetical protein
MRSAGTHIAISAPFRTSANAEVASDSQALAVGGNERPDIERQLALATCHHEASHAVVAWRLGEMKRVRQVTSDRKLMAKYGKQAEQMVERDWTMIQKLAFDCSSASAWSALRSGTYLASLLAAAARKTQSEEENQRLQDQGEQK